MRGKPRVFRFGLPRPDACFVKAYPAETGADKFTQSAQARPRAFLDGHVSAFGFFGGVPISILYGNLKIAAARILGHGKFLAMASASADKFTRSAQA